MSSSWLLLSLPLTLTKASNVYTEPAIYERLSHFADHGVPATVHDPLNQAMIADASCRVLGNHDGFAYYHNDMATAAVIAAYAKLPNTGSPSHFTLSAHDTLAKACTAAEGEKNNTTTAQQCSQLPLSSLTGGMDAWHRALCASANDSSWNGVYDPAYQPQQISLTVGFMCIVSCDCAKTELSADTMASFAASDGMASDVRENLCATLPFHDVNFTKQASSPASLAELSAPLRKLCSCEKR